MLLERGGRTKAQGPVPGGFSDDGTVFLTAAVCQLLHPGLLCTAGSDRGRDGDRGGLCAGTGLTGYSGKNQAGCHYAIRSACGMMKVFYGKGVGPDAGAGMYAGCKDD